MNDVGTLDWATIKGLFHLLKEREFRCSWCGVVYFTNHSWCDGEEFICDECAREALNGKHET